jgi:murein DD-endopeptidase MepM/ murein hydrolase activator NlpD
MGLVRHFQAVVFSATILLTACSQTVDNRQHTVEPIPSSTTAFSPTTTYTSLPQTTSTATPIPCNPFTVDFCIDVGTFLLQRPITAPGTATVDRGYAYGSTAGGTRNPHRGVEFYNGSGTPVLAAAEGTVVFAGDDGSTKFCPFFNFYGNLVVLQHNLSGQILYTLYGHLSKIDSTTGQSVLAGEKIAEVGASGSAIGSHLHFEVRLDPVDETSTLDPELWLVPLRESGVLSMRFTDAINQFIQVQSNVQYYPDPTGTFTQAWQPEAYSPEMSRGNNWENVVLGNLLPGQYRITYLWEGVLYERWAEIQSGKLTRTAFEVP